MELELSQNLEPLVWPLSEDEQQALMQSILQNGSTEPLHAWREILLDNFFQYQICRKHGIPYQIHELSLKNWEEATIWVCKNQLQRLNLPSEMRKYLIGKRYGAEKILAARSYVRRNQYSPIPEASEVRKSHKNEYNRTASPLAQEYRICCATVQKYGTFAAAIDRIGNIERTLRIQILSGQICVAHDNVVTLACMNEMQLKLIIAFLHEKEKAHLNTEDLEQIVGYVNTAKKKTGRNCIQSSVKDMPAYDPDTAVLGLALTIPSWCSSVRRVYNASDFNTISVAARDRLCAGLRVLQDEIESIKQAAKEGNAP